VYDMYKWNGPDAGTGDGLVTTTTTHPRGGSSQRPGTWHEDVPNAARAGAANGHRSHAADRTRTAGLTPATRAVQAALDRRDNGGDAGGLRGQ
jgi:hypothetical protein